jgi:hypothetical protein
MAKPNKEETNINNEEKIVNPITGEKPAETRKEKPKAPVKKIVLKNTLGKEVSEENYFFGGKAPSSFEGSCGLPVEREDLLDVFNKIFKPEDNILFYRQRDKEVYIVIIPLKYSSTIGAEHNSIEGDFQKHAISFLNEGSVNLDTLKLKLKRIVPFVKFTDR